MPKKIVGEKHIKKYKRKMYHGSMFNTRSVETIEKNARKAIWADDVDGLTDALKKGASNDIYTMYPITWPKKISKTSKNNLVEIALIKLRIKDASACLTLLEDLGFNIEKAIERVVDPTTLVDFRTQINFMKFIIARWPTSFGKIQDVINLHDMAKVKELGSSQKFTWLVRCGFHVDERDPLGKTALMVSKNGESVASLLANGANPNAVCHGGKTAIWHIVKNTLLTIRVDENKNLIMEGTNASALIEICKEQRLLDDPRAVLISKQITKKIDAGLVIDGVPARDFQPLRGVLTQVDQIMSAYFQKSLQKSLQRKAELLGPSKNMKPWVKM